MKRKMGHVLGECPEGKHYDIYNLIFVKCSPQIVNRYVSMS